MSIEFVGMLNPSEWTETRQSTFGAIDVPYILRMAKVHEEAGFDRVLIASGPGMVDSLQTAAFAAANTERLGFMIAHRPGLTAPTVAARAFASLDQLSKGRIRLHAITGIREEPEEGDTLADKAARYARTDEYLQILRKTWTSQEPFDFDGEYYRIRGAFSGIRPYQQPHIPISFGGSSEYAYRVGVKHADLYGIWGEPLAETAQQIATIREYARQAGVPSPRISLSVRLILGQTEELAWQRAHNILEAIKNNPDFSSNSPLRQISKNGVGSQRLLAAAAKGDLHDRALWMPTAVATGAYGDTTALVGTPDTVISALLDYVDLGVTTFLNRGYDPYYDAIDYGRWIIPAVKAAARNKALAA